jgi:hypothetical protein
LGPQAVENKKNKKERNRMRLTVLEKWNVVDLGIPELC